MPKFILYTSHDEILGALFRAFNWDYVKGAMPASALFVEFYQPAGTSSPDDIMVRAFYNSTAYAPGISVPIDGHPEGESLNIHDFKAFLSEQLGGFEFQGDVA
jgi:hypothetical protein